jgi:S1-C subfamily serine protease
MAKTRIIPAVGAAFLAGVVVTLGLIQFFGSAGGPLSTASAATATAGSGTNGNAVSASGLSPEDIYQNVRPSVVEIAVTATVRSGRFGQRQQQISATGTGIVIDGSGHILTNYHVIAGAQTVEVRFDDGATVSAVIGGTDPANDVAVIKVDPSAHSLAPATLGDASTVRVGDSVLALGNPLELDGTLTKGIVSGLNRTFAEDSNTTLTGLIQTDAAVNPGNSGGPLLDSQGQVIGINTLLDNPTGETVFVGVAFAVSINTVKTELVSLIP